MGFSLQFQWKPTPWGPHIAHDRLTTFINVNVFNNDLLLSFATVSVECLSRSAFWSALLQAPSSRP
jgi:hypothetical protein